MSNDVSGAQDARPPRADASALGYLSLGLTLVAFGLFSTHVIHNTAMSDASRMALLIGGVVQFIAGMWEFHRGSAFTGTAFAVLGGFFATWSAGSGAAISANTIGTFMILWAAVALSLTLAGWQLGAVAQSVFGLFTISLVLFGIAAFADNTNLAKAAGWVGAAAGALAWYGGTAHLTNATWGRQAMPMGIRLAVPHRSSHAH